MENSKQMKTILSIENQPESIEVFEFLKELTPEQKKGYLLFINGVKFEKLLKSYKEEDEIKLKEKENPMNKKKTNKNDNQIDIFSYFNDRGNLITEAQ